MTRVLVVGDIMLDEFVYGDVHRISPEAATPILSTTHTERMIGGAGNVARGVAALGCECDLVGVVGADHAGKVLMREIGKWARVTPWLPIDMARATTHKMRFVSEQHSSHLLRVDCETALPVSGTVEQNIIKNALAVIATTDVKVVVLSDYCKGALTPAVIKQVIERAQARALKIVVDSKRADLSAFWGAGWLKLNASELGDRSPQQLMHECGIGRLIVTEGENGLTLHSRWPDEPIHIPGQRVRVRDVSGAGDTVVAVFATMLARGSGVHYALEQANLAAAIAVGKPGTAAVTTAELDGGKIGRGWDGSDLLNQRLQEWRGQRIGFTNGCFDLLHPGHVKLLEHAKTHCDKLIVGLNSDASVTAVKGAGRPIQKQTARAEVLAALDSVDLVVIFDDLTPHDLIERIRPNVLVKGGDYTGKDIVGHEFAGTVVILARDHNSTTDLVSRAREGA